MGKILSISVAAYNVENLIKDNLDSFVNSEVREDIEVIVTDDGSKDSTRDIVKEYEKKYPGIVRLIEQKNAGPGSTVNSGIKHAKGKYFRMVDWDDWVDTKNLKPLIEFLKNNDPDIVVTKYTEVYNGTDKTREVGIPNKLMNQILDLGKNCEDFEFQMHNTTYKTELLQKNNIVLDNGFYTDVEYLILPFPYVKTVAFLDLNLYMYRLSLEGQSVSLESMQKNRAMHETVLKRILRYYEENKQKGIIEKSILNCILNRVVNMSMLHTITLISFKPSKIYKKELKEIYDFIKQNSNDVYNRCMERKYIRILNKTNFITYPLFAIRHRMINHIK